MRYFKYGVMGLLCLSGQVMAYDDTFSFGLGSRVDQFDWSIGVSPGPNVLSELTWKNVEVYEAKLEYSKVIDDWLYFRTRVRSGRIMDGRVQDSDYLGNARTMEFSRSMSDSEKGGTVDADLAVGIPVTYSDIDFAPEITLIPMFGYSHHYQYFRMHDGVQVVPADGPFDGLNSTYDTEWKGMFFGFDAYFKTGRKLSLYMQAELHNASYEAVANWNLRTDFKHPKSFEHEADEARGVIVALGYLYHINRRWSYSLHWEHQDWETKSGKDKTYFSDGTTGETKLNSVNWTNKRVDLTFKYHF